METFRAQIEENISELQETNRMYDCNLDKPEYAFNYWILSRIFNMDEAIIKENITEYNDSGIDCFFSDEDNKELFIIQNKFYAPNTTINREEFSDFLKAPISILSSGNYKKSIELQNTFSKAKTDKEYKVFFYFFTTALKGNISDEKRRLFTLFNDNTPINAECHIEAEVFALEDIYKLYFGKNKSPSTTFNFNLKTYNKSGFARLKEEYGLNVPFEGYYIVTPVIEFYRMLKTAEEKKYEIFEDNIREFLGLNPINKEIIKTLKDPEKRKSFIYYNNGVTLICNKNIIPQTIDGNCEIPLSRPQIVNGCQTVNSINYVLKNYSDKTSLKQEFSNVFVMVKVLIIPDPNDEVQKKFYEDVVKYTNSQNSLSEKAFVSMSDYFLRIQKELKNLGFLLCVKPSDKNKFKTEYSSRNKVDLVELAKRHSEFKKFPINTEKDIILELDKLLQVFVAFMNSPTIAIQKKSQLLKKKSPICEDYSFKISYWLTLKNMIQLYLMYNDAEKEMRNINSSDGIKINPFLIVGILGYLIRSNHNDLNPEYLRQKIDMIFSDMENYNSYYILIKKISLSYTRKIQGDSDYNSMIKKPIEKTILDEQIEQVLLVLDDYQSFYENLVN